MHILVTGGGGFLGKAIVRRLLDEGHSVRSLARGDYPELREWGVDARRGDLAEAEVVAAACEGCDAVFHVAAKAGVWGPYAAYHRANVLGTQNIIAGCRAQGVGRLVYTSTPSVVHVGGDIEGADESLPYGEHFATHYPATKAEAERAVLAANGEGLATVALRPHLIWGPGDTNLVPRVLDRGRRGRLRLVGKTPKLVDTIYIDNCVEAHLDALRALPSGSCGGKAYFVSNGDPQPQDRIINGILAAGGLPPVSRRISRRVAWTVGLILEGVYGLFRIQSEPMMTRFVAEQLATAHWYDISAARRDLGYSPRVSIDEGMERLREALAA